MLAYPVLGTVALWSGAVEHLVSGENLTVVLRQPAYTWWPGRLHLARVHVAVDGNTQLVVMADDATVELSLVELFRRHFDVSAFRARNLSYRMRTKVQDSEKTSRRVAAFPPLDGLSPVAPKRSHSDNEGPSWSVQIRGIDAQVTDLWFFEYHFVGVGRVRGGFMESDSAMRVDQSSQTFESGELRFGADRVIAKNVKGRVSASIAENDPGKERRSAFLAKIEADVELDARVESLAAFSSYLETMEVEGGAGTFSARLKLSDGAFAAASRLAYSTDDIRLTREGFGLRSDWTFDARAERQPDGKVIGSFSANARSTYVSFAKANGAPFTLQAHEQEHTATSSATALDSSTSLLELRLNFPQLVTTDLDDLDELWNAGESSSISKGTARGSLHLSLDEHKQLRGPFQATFDDLRLDLGNWGATAAGRTKFQVTADPLTGRVSLEQLKLDVNPLVFRAGTRAIDHWWMHLSSSRVVSQGWPPREVTATVDLTAKDAAPLLEALAARDELPDLVPRLVSLSDLRAHMKVRKVGGKLDLILNPVNTALLDCRGRIYLKGEKRLLALILGGDAVSLGIFQRDGDTEYEALPTSSWLQRKLALFP